ncbi:GntR family transcriptional regulator [Segetibacter sp.]|jgi:GntR family transcriptional regulator|uniref:GntR family transcriptional regulator n=1 Tax=Segetibacter sp. TaxID=2231182 RepID=UPI002606518E|nr:GntR family transcriptional regulator [Segetibacter sp.]MCW3079701.1 transcriptional regulator [Segetibacter sp.]
MKSKFISLSENIIEKIKAGELLPGDKIPSENELIKKYKISNTTARKILLEIETKGWGRRIKGKGTFVLNKTPQHQLVRTIGSIDATRRGFNDYLIAEGFTPKNIILEKTVLKEGISAEINGKHYIIQGPVLKIHQLRYADDEVMKDETRFISLTLCPKIDRLSTEISYFKTYESSYKLKISDLKQSLSVDIFSPESTLNNFEGSTAIPVFILDSVVLCNPDQVIEVEKSYYRGDKYKFSVIVNPAYNKIEEDKG